MSGGPFHIVVAGTENKAAKRLLKAAPSDSQISISGNAAHLEEYLKDNLPSLVISALVPAELDRALTRSGRRRNELVIVGLISSRQAGSELNSYAKTSDTVVTMDIAAAELWSICRRLLTDNSAAQENPSRQETGALTSKRDMARKLERAERELISANSELERLTRELEVMSYRDSLTGLYNHQTFQERIREELARARRHQSCFTVLFGDIDNFSKINQSMGYQFGDEVLRRLASVITASDSPSRIRESDVAARFGGEEIVLLLPETDKHGGVIKAQRICDTISTTNFSDLGPVTMSFGVASYPDDANSVADLLSAAETALKTAKAQGRNQVSCVSQTQPGDSGSLPSPSERIRSTHERMAEIVGILRRDKAATCLFVDLSSLRRVEHELGAAQYAVLFDRAGVVIDEMRGNQLRNNDVICRQNNDDAYVCVLAPSRDPDPTKSFDVDRVADRVEKSLNKALSMEVRELIRDEPRITVGHGRVLNNSMVRPERLISRLIDEARASAVLAREREAQRNKSVLQELILTNSLRPVYQPIVDLEERRIFAYEALTRGPKNSTLESPAALFSVADEVDLTFELDRACFRGALRGAVGLAAEHKLFVNLLPLSFYDTQFIENEVQRLLEAADLKPHNIVFEITERLAIENFASFRRALANYTRMGFGVAIDDVGTRHSNLETVMALQPHFIKVSDVLTRGVARSRVRREMLRSLRHIAEAVDAVVVAEGIETEDDLEVLINLGLRFGQGFFLGRPGPPFPKVPSSVLGVVGQLANAQKIVPPIDETGPPRAMTPNPEEAIPEQIAWEPLSVTEPTNVGDQSFLSTITPKDP